MGLVSEAPPLTPSQHSDSNNAATDSNNIDGGESKKLKKVDYKFDFGKHRGRSWEDVPEDYRDWLLREKVWETKGREKLLEALTEAGFETS